jgi:PAS domain S-box-containing protein
MIFEYEGIKNRAVLNRDFITFDENCKVAHAIKVMLASGNREMLITNREGFLIGVVTLQDLREFFSKGPQQEMILSDIMTKNLITAELEQSLSDTRNLMIRNKIGLIPIISENKIVGIIREREILDNFYTEMEKDLKRLANVVNIMHEAVCLLDKNGKVLIWNDNAAKLYGIPTEKILGNNINDFFPDAINARVLITKEAVNSLYHSPKEGSHVIVNAEPIFINGEFGGVVTTDRDVSEVKELSLKLANATDQMDFLKKQVKNISDDNFGRVIGRSKAILEQVNIAKQVAKSNASILVTGESGTGKEVFARSIHDYCFDDMKDSLFVPINCSAIPNELFESELFGYEAGAFTGASKKGKMGMFELANYGTIFLDEIGDMPLFMQAKLLRVLQERKLKRVGGEKFIDINARIISATNKDLAKMVEEGTFREDLYYRLNVIELKLPPLRDRKGDILLLVDQLVKDEAIKNNKKIHEITPEAMEILTKYRWKGNIRELKNTIEYLVVLSTNGVLSENLIPLEIRNEVKSYKKDENDTIINSKIDKNFDLNHYLEEQEKNIIRETLEFCKGNKAKTAKILKIPRATLYYKIDQYSISVDK